MAEKKSNGSKLRVHAGVRTSAEFCIVTAEHLLGRNRNLKSRYLDNRD